ncbi:hypothetical protein [Amycolatopsis magusensis]|uniref:MinD-like ATPase involved in chromosome partitioning or flagellar assembly n=1 Tax=Amycolatopsis magusensis TaxID=882444 RepID=A0ABS4PU08_9PSEU|nr:hypothetical protein [Amycolatopsis magusensis]MBP2182917.1 hypothetical protein [Amycolatopsis magusensis]
MEAITAAFTDRGAHVVLVDLDTATRPVADRAPATGDGALVAAREAVRALERTVETLTPGPHTPTATASPRPFWAGLVTDSADPPTVLTEAPAVSARPGARGSADVLTVEHGTRVDLVLALLPARAAETVSLDRLALLAAQRLRHGGIFAVYTHSDWNQGRLVDPTGAIVAACQHADLLYLQHVVVLHTPIENGRLHAAPNAAVTTEYERARHRATVRGLPAPHLRAHGDVLAFAQPADPATPPPQPDSATAAPSPGADQ